VQPLDHLAQRLDHPRHPVVTFGLGYQRRLIATETNKDYAARILVDAAERLDRNLRDAQLHSRYYALKRLERTDPAFVQRVQNHRRLEQRERDQREWAEREKEPVQKDRGRSL